MDSDLHPSGVLDKSSRSLPRRAMLFAMASQRSGLWDLRTYE